MFKFFTCTKVFFKRNVAIFNDSWSTIYLFNLWASVLNRGHICFKRCHLQFCIVSFFLFSILLTTDLLDWPRRVMLKHCLWIRNAPTNFLRCCGKIKALTTMNLFPPKWVITRKKDRFWVLWYLCFIVYKSEMWLQVARTSDWHYQ